MTAAERAGATSGASVRPIGLAARAAAFVGTLLVIVALAVLPLLTPLFVRAALDASGSAGLLGLDTAAARAMSDRSIEAIVVPLSSFAFEGPDGRPFYGAAERSHLADARTLLWLSLAGGAVSAVLLAAGIARSDPVRRAGIWRSVGLAGATAAVAVVVLGVVSLVAFGALFTLFHEVFFPGGNWSFDPATQRLVQLYPFRFWQIAAAAFGALVLVLGAAAWWLARRRLRDEPARPAPGPAAG